MRTLTTLCIGLLITVVHLRAQVTVAGSTGANGNFATLAAAFTAINSIPQTGNSITITITGTTTEPATSATLIAGMWASLLVQPSGAAVVQGNSNPGAPLIGLDGADHVTFDGLNTGGNSLTLVNGTSSATPGTSTIRFMHDAQNNVITRCSIKGCTIMNTGTDGGTVLFWTAAPTGTGNDNNTISFCDIGPAGMALPTKAVTSSGTTSVPAMYNTGLQVLNNNIFDFFNNAASSHGVYVYGGTSNMTISDNRFYQTALRTYSTGASHCPIAVAHMNASNITITNNVIGFGTSAGTGIYRVNGAGTGSRFIAITIMASGSVSVQGNVITAIDLGGTLFGSGNLPAFAGISAEAGPCSIGNVVGNTIGSLSAAGSILVQTATSNAIDVRGIHAITLYTTNVSNNNVGGITMNNTGSGGGTFTGIHMATSTNALQTIQGNTIGSSTAPLVNNSPSAASRVIGINSQVGITTASNNTITDLTMSATNAGSGLLASMLGLVVDNASANTAPSLVSHNTVRRLSNTSTGAVRVSGIVFSGNASVTSNVEGNVVYTLSCGGSLGAVTGLSASGGTATYANNMVRVGRTNSGGMVLTGFAMQGIAHTGGDAAVLHNSVYIGGMPISGANDTYGLFSSATSAMRTYHNNILFNMCDNAGGTGTHMAIRVAVLDPGLLTSNNNVLRAAGIGGATGRVNATTLSDLASWQTFTSLDGASITADPGFTAATAGIPDLHISGGTPIESAGAAPTVTNDFDGQGRSTITPVDIGADAGLFTTPFVSIIVRVMLEGSYNPNTGFMSDALRSAGLVPLTEPYTAMGYTYVGTTGGTIAPAVLTIPGADAVHDWVIVELRSAANPSVIVVSRSALIQRDGQLCELDGTSPMTFSVPPDSYYLAVRHRNHLGVMSAVPIGYTATPSFLDMAAVGFTSYGTQGQKGISGTWPAQALWMGDVTFDHVIKYTGANNDRDPILVAIGGTVPTNTVTGYLRTDVNLDGVVKYTGANNDRDPMLVNIGGTVPTNTRVEQVP